MGKGVGAGALAADVFPLAGIAQLRRLSPRASAASLAVLLLYPVVFNTAIFDFHAEVLAFPLVLQVLAWLERRAPGDHRPVNGAFLIAPTLSLKNLRISRLKERVIPSVVAV